MTASTVALAALVGCECPRSGRQRPTTTRPILLAHPQTDLAPLGQDAVGLVAAQALGLVCRPPRQTVADTLAWWRGLPAAQQRFEATGLSPERERALLA